VPNCDYSLEGELLMANLSCEGQLMLLENKVDFPGDLTGV
jgi:hypothetical protein